MKFELISQLAQKGIFTKCSAGFCLENMVEKIGDIKNGGSCKEALLHIAEAINLDFVSQEVISLNFSLNITFHKKIFQKIFCPYTFQIIYY